MCGVFGVVLPPAAATGARRPIAALGLFALQHRGQESAGRRGQRRRAADALQGPRDDRVGPRRAPPAQPPRAASRSPTAATRRPARRSGRTPSRRSASGRGGRSRSATTATSSTPASCSASSRGGRGAAAGLDRHGAPDRAARRRAGGGHRRRPRRASCPASAARSASSILDERRVIGVRDPFGFRPLVLGRLPAPDRPAARAPGLWRRRRRDVGWVPVVRDGRRSTSSAPSSCATSSPARSSSSSRASAPRSVRFAAGDARPVRVRAHLLRPARLVHGGPQPVRGRGAGWAMELAARAPGRRRPRHAGPGHRRAGGGRLRRGVRASRTARAWSATATPAGRSSSRRQTMRQRGVTIKLNPLREVVRGKRLTVVDDSIVRGHDDQADRRAAAQGRRRPRSTSGSARRRSTTRASTASTPRSRPS